MKWLTSGVPLPLGGVTRNKRSFVYLENLSICNRYLIDHTAAANKTFLVQYDEDLSTAELLRRMGSALAGRRGPSRKLAGLLRMAAHRSLASPASHSVSAVRCR